MSKNYIRVKMPDGRDHKAFRDELTQSFMGARGDKGGRITSISDDIRAEPGVMAVKVAGSVTPEQRQLLKNFSYRMS